MTNLARNQYEMLASFAKANLTTEQIFNLSHWLAMHNSNYSYIRFLIASGLAPEQITTHFQKEAA